MTNGGDNFSITLGVSKADANIKKSRRRMLPTFFDGWEADNSNYYLGLNKKRIAVGNAIQDTITGGLSSFGGASLGGQFLFRGAEANVETINQTAMPPKAAVVKTKIP